MKKRIFAILTLFALCFSLTACAKEEPIKTHIFMSLSAEAYETSDETVRPALAHEISFPKTAFERRDLLSAVQYGAEALGYSCVRDGKYSEILVNLAERPHGAGAYWKLEAKDAAGTVVDADWTTPIDDIAYISLAYVNN